MPRGGRTGLVPNRAELGPVAEHVGRGAMVEWVPRFDYPAEDWLLLDGSSPDGAERIARQVADRGGRQNKRYAKAVHKELKFFWADALEEHIEPVAVYVPPVWRHTPPVLPASVHAKRYTPPFERTLDVVMARANTPMDDPALSPIQEPEIAAVELPAGPACRVYEASLADTGYRGEQVKIEYVHYYVLPEVYSKDILLLNATWHSYSVGSGMVELADRIAATLTFTKRGSGEGPHPVLAPTESYFLFDEVQIGKGLRPLAQHGFVTIEKGVLSLLGNGREPIVSAPLQEISAWPMRVSFGTAVALEIDGTTYNAAPGRGSYPKAFTLPSDLLNGRRGADQLLELIVEGGGKQK